MPLPLEGRLAIVTGAGVRVGRAIAEALVDNGANLVAHYRSSAEGAEQLVRRAVGLGRKAIAVQADLTDEKERARVFAAAEALGGCDLLVNSAAIFERRPVGDIDEAAWNRMIETNLTAPFFCCRAAAESMRRKGGGDIVNIVDVAGGFLAWPGYAHYCSAKAGLAMLTKCLALELAPTIRVNGVAPGPVLLPEGVGEAETRRALARVPLGRTGAPEDVARTVLFLLTSSSYLTGQIIAVDGGRSIA